LTGIRIVPSVKIAGLPADIAYDKVVSVRWASWKMLGSFQLRSKRKKLERVLIGKPESAQITLFVQCRLDGIYHAGLTSR
jgi:hypothetical protein